MQELKPFLQKQRALFNELGIESPILSAELLLAAALGLERQSLLKQCIIQPATPIPPHALENFEAFRIRRMAGEPVAYILGVKEFYGRNFAVNRSTLIPRPETELIIDTALELMQGKKSGHFADLGTGTGCIAITLALELGAGWQGTALDLSAPAIKTARQNASTYGLSQQINFEQADFNNYAFLPASLDLLVSNPPYISENEYATLDIGVRNFEPKTALVPAAGKFQPADGTADLKCIACSAAQALKPGGVLLMEMGCTQGADMLEELKQMQQLHNCWQKIDILPDLAGLDRIVYAKLVE